MRRTEIRGLQQTVAKGYLHKRGTEILESVMVKAGHVEDRETEPSVDGFTKVWAVKLLFYKNETYILESIGNVKIINLYKDKCSSKT